jgi:hypothetical protein
MKRREFAALLGGDRPLAAAVTDRLWSIEQLQHASRAPWRRMIFDPRLGAHILCFELSDERSETRWERCRE